MRMFVPSADVTQLRDHGIIDLQMDFLEDFPTALQDIFLAHTWVTNKCGCLNEVEHFQMKKLD